MMDDRKLLEFAAKAAGMWKESFSVNDVGTPDYSEYKGYRLAWGKGWWNPVTDDGDALRLAVKLGLSVEVCYDTSQPFAWLRVSTVEEDWFEAMPEEYKADPYAATRRAIVRAAAAIGEQMP